LGGYYRVYSAKENVFNILEIDPKKILPLPSLPYLPSSPSRKSLPYSSI
jgi:hypothetical protein